MKNLKYIRLHIKNEIKQILPYSIKPFTFCDMTILDMRNVCSQTWQMEDARKFEISFKCQIYCLSFCFGPCLKFKLC